MKRLLAALLAFGIVDSAVGQLIADMIDVPVAVSSPVAEIVGQARQVSMESAVALPPFTGVVVQGTATGDTLRGLIRFESGGTWSEWAPLYIVRSFTDEAFLAAYRGNETRVASRFELRFEVEKSESVRILQAGTFLDEENQPPPEAARENQQADFVIWAPALHDRAEWGAEPYRGTPVPLNQPDYYRMTLHHTAGFAAVTLTEGLEQVKRIQDFHQNGRGWSDIGYHFLMDQEGRLYQGRPFLNPSVPFDDGPPLVRGAHAGGSNTGNIGVSLMGCYHPPEGSDCRHVMTGAAMDSLVVTYAYLSERYSVDPDALRGHRDFGNTACPGDNNYALLPTFRTLIADLLITGNAALGTAALSAVADTIGVVSLRWRFLTDAGIESYSITREDSDGAAVIVERQGTSDGEWVDSGISTPGAATYRLTVRGSRNRHQILSTATVQVEAQQSYFLSHSFPNPASEQATIRYYLQQPGIVTLHVFDVAGRRVARLTEAYRPKDSWHAVTLDTSGLSGGTYFYQLHVEGFASTIYQAAFPLVVAH